MVLDIQFAMFNAQFLRKGLQRKRLSQKRRHNRLYVDEVAASRPSMTLHIHELKECTLAGAMLDTNPGAQLFESLDVEPRSCCGW